MPYDNEMSGALFQNKNKTRDAQPGWKGTTTIEGKEYWVSGWVNVPKDGGDKYISLRYEEKEVQNSLNESSNNDFDDDIPF